MAEIWELRPEQRERALASGYTQEQIDAVEATRRADWFAIKDSIQQGMSDEEFATYYKRRYGIDHVCHCAEDKFLGRVVMAPECLLDFHDHMVDKVNELLPERDALQEAVDSLRMQVAELGGSPRA